MFNRDAWSKIFERAYGYKSRKVKDIWLFKTKQGEEMNIVGDYLEFKKDYPAGLLRFDENPKSKEFYVAFETYRLKCNKPFEKLLMQDVHQKARNLIYKAEKAGVKSFLSDDLKTYYKMYVHTMLRINAIPQSYVLFREMRKEFGKDFLLFLSEYEGKIVSGIVALLDGKRLHVWSNGQSKSARKVSANMATYTEVLRYACERGLEVDFGNTEPDSSLAFFKSRFGAKKVPIWTNAPKGSARNFKFITWPLRLLPAFLVSIKMRFLFKYFR